jgi:transposase InsO family protein
MPVFSGVAARRVSYINIRGTFCFLCGVLDGCSRSIVQWDLRERMQAVDVEVILQRARELHPGVGPRIISDNGPQFIARDFKAFERECGMTHVRAAPFYPRRKTSARTRLLLIPSLPYLLGSSVRTANRWPCHFKSVPRPPRT